MYKQPFKLFIEKWIDFLQGHFSCFHLGCSKLILCLTSPCKYKIYLGVEKIKRKKIKTSDFDQFTSIQIPVQ